MQPMRYLKLFVIADLLPIQMRVQSQGDTGVLFSSMALDSLNFSTVTETHQTITRMHLQHVYLTTPAFSGIIVQSCKAIIQTCAGSTAYIFS